MANNLVLLEPREKTTLLQELLKSLDPAQEAKNKTASVTENVSRPHFDAIPSVVLVTPTPSATRTVTVIGTGNSVHVNEGEPNKQNKSKQDNFFGLVVAGVLAIASIFFAGKTAQEETKAKELCDKFQSLQQPGQAQSIHTIFTTNHISNIPSVTEIAMVVKEALAIHNNSYNKLLAYTRGTRLLAAASFVAFIGIYATIPWMATAGVISGLAALGYLAHTLGTHWSDSPNLKGKAETNRQKLLSALDRLPPEQLPAGPRYEPIDDDRSAQSSTIPKFPPPSYDESSDTRVHTEDKKPEPNAPPRLSNDGFQEHRHLLNEQ